MAWETRGSGRYYYRKERQGDRVISEYVGTGSLAQMIANLDETSRRELEHERQVLAKEQAAEMVMDRDIDHSGDIVRVMTHASLLVKGYHTHKGQWRKLNVSA